jgi:hypothetical protein
MHSFESPNLSKLVPKCRFDFAQLYLLPQLSLLKSMQQICYDDKIVGVL